MNRKQSRICPIHRMNRLMVAAAILLAPYSEVKPINARDAKICAGLDYGTTAKPNALPVTDLVPIEQIQVAERVLWPVSSIQS